MKTGWGVVAVVLVTVLFPMTVFAQDPEPAAEVVPLQILVQGEFPDILVAELDSNIIKEPPVVAFGGADEGLRNRNVAVDLRILADETSGYPPGWYEFRQVFWPGMDEFAVVGEKLNADGSSWGLGFGPIFVPYVRSLSGWGGIPRASWVSRVVFVIRDIETEEIVGERLFYDRESGFGSLQYWGGFEVPITSFKLLTKRVRLPIVRTK